MPVQAITARTEQDGTFSGLDRPGQLPPQRINGIFQHVGRVRQLLAAPQLLQQHRGRSDMLPVERKVTEQLPRLRQLGCGVHHAAPVGNDGKVSQHFYGDLLEHRATSGKFLSILIVPHFRQKVKHSMKFLPL